MGQYGLVSREDGGKMKIDIQNRDDLLKCFDLLHDSIVKEDEISYNAEKKILEICVERDLLDSTAVFVEKNILFFKKIRHPIIKTMLHLQNVDFYNKQSSDNTLRTHTFNECKENRQEKYFILLFCEVLQIKLKFSGEPVGVLSDIEQTNGSGSFWKFYFPIPFTLSGKK
jgi:hypothetical protein